MDDLLKVIKPVQDAYKSAYVQGFKDGLKKGLDYVIYCP